MMVLGAIILAGMFVVFDGYGLVLALLSLCFIAAREEKNGKTEFLSGRDTLVILVVLISVIGYFVAHQFITEQKLIDFAQFANNFAVDSTRFGELLESQVLTENCSAEGRVMSAECAKHRSSHVFLATFFGQYFSTIIFLILLYFTTSISSWTDNFLQKMDGGKSVAMFILALVLGALPFLWWKSSLIDHLMLSEVNMHPAPFLLVTISIWFCAWFGWQYLMSFARCIYLK